VIDVKSAIDRRWNPRHATWIVALALVFQAVLVGFAQGAMAGRSFDEFGVVCSSIPQNADAPEKKSSPTSHVGLCCVFHSSSAIELDAARAPVKAAAVRFPPAPTISIFRIDAVHSAPELRPVCSRAPPARSV
jgi:hypothetical protein